MVFDLPECSYDLILIGIEKHVGKELTLVAESVQVQRGVVDCGVFAVLNLVESLIGTDLRKINFDQTKVRQHIVDCLRLGEWKPFPRVQIPIKLPHTRAYTIHEKVN